MRNLAEDKDADRYIREELRMARIEAEISATAGNPEIFTIVMGRLGAFEFRRAWRYYVVTGPFPLAVASALYESDPAWKRDVRAAGHCGCPHPKDWADRYDAEGREILDRKNERQATEYANQDESPFMKDIGQKILERHVFADDPAAVAARSIVSSFHIDSELGLRLFADAVRGLP